MSVGELEHFALAESVDAVVRELAEVPGADHRIAPSASVRTNRRAAFSDFFHALNAIRSKHLHVLFLPDHVPASLGGIDLPRFAPEQAVAIRRDVFLHLPEGTGRSKLAAAIHKHTKAAGTQRNWRTVTALAALADQFNSAA